MINECFVFLVCGAATFLRRFAAATLRYLSQFKARSGYLEGHLHSCQILRNYRSSLVLVSGQSVHVAVKGDLELAKGLRLNLTRVLQFADPVGLLLLKASHLRLNLHSLVVFLVDLPDEV